MKEAFHSNPEILFRFNHCGLITGTRTLCLFVRARMLSFPYMEDTLLRVFYVLCCMNSPRWDLYQLLIIIVIVVDNIIGIIIINYYLFTDEQTGV